MKRIPVVSYYTKDTPYEQEAITMMANARGVGIERVHLYKVDSRGSWVANCAIKPEVLLSAALRLKQPFLYVDSDARFEKFPLLFSFQWPHDYDIGVHFFKGSELLSGTIWVNPTPATIRLLEDWIRFCAQLPSQWDQKVLQRVLSMQNGLRVFHLPPEYAWIFDLSAQHYGSMSPVIVHYQKSREYKRGIGGGNR